MISTLAKEFMISLKDLCQMRLPSHQLRQLASEVQLTEEVKVTAEPAEPGFALVCRAADVIPFANSTVAFKATTFDLQIGCYSFEEDPVLFFGQISGEISSWTFLEKGYEMKKLYKRGCVGIREIALTDSAIVKPIFMRKATTAELSRINQAVSASIAHW